MFIISKRSFQIQRSGREPFRIKKDFVGEIPDEIAGHWLVQAAIADGTIATPSGKRDAALEKADEEAEEKAARADIRPDAHLEDEPAEKTAEKAQKKQGAAVCGQ